MKLFNDFVKAISAIVFILPSTIYAEVFLKNPVPSVTSSAISSEFMQINGEPSTRGFHTGTDVPASIGSEVYAPIADNTTCQIFAKGSSYIYLIGAVTQGSDYVVILLAHIDPDPNITVGSYVSNSTLLGTLSDQHLHVEIILSADRSIASDLSELYNPREYGFSQAEWNYMDYEPPVIDETVLDNEDAQVGERITWFVKAHDVSGSYYNGIGALYLYIDDAMQDSFQFERFRTKGGQPNPELSEFYGCTTCIPSGTNNPNVIQYKLAWQRTDPNAHVWKLKWADAYGNSKTGDPDHPPAVEITGKIPAIPASIRAFPNPFTAGNGSNVKFKITSPREDRVEMSVYDVNGKLVKKLFTGKIKQGDTQTAWDGSNEKGQNVSAGVYFMKLKGKHFSNVKKIVVVR